ncbi:MAG: sigma factor-like helix-turn-helix DNA-binding protein [Limnochordia bacterium]
MENESFREILTCIRQLPETLRTIVYYRYVVDLTAKQVSLLTNLRISTSIFHTHASANNHLRQHQRQEVVIGEVCPVPRRLPYDHRA